MVKPKKTERKKKYGGVSFEEANKGFYMHDLETDTYYEFEMVFDGNRKIIRIKKTTYILTYITDYKYQSIDSNKVTFFDYLAWDVKEEYANNLIVNGRLDKEFYKKNANKMLKPKLFFEYSDNDIGATEDGEISKMKRFAQEAKSNGKCRQTLSYKEYAKKFGYD